MSESVRKGRISAFVNERDVDDATNKFIFDLLTARAVRHEHEFLCEKTPSNALVFEELIDLFPEAKFIFVVRDPRDVVASMKTVKQRYRMNGEVEPAFCRDAYASAQTIRSYLDKGYSASNKSDRVLVVHYEDVVREPETTLRNVCAFLNIEFDPKMLRIEESKFDSADTKSIKHWYDQMALRLPIVASKEPKHQGVLTAIEVSMVSYMLSGSPYVDRYGLNSGQRSLLFGWIGFNYHHACKAALNGLRNAGRALLRQ